MNPALTFLNSIHYHTADEANDASKVCMDHDHEKLRPQLISTWMPNGVGAMPGKRVIFAETQVGLKVRNVECEMRTIPRPLTRFGCVAPNAIPN